MIESEEHSTTPLFSIVIPVYNDWSSLEQCLQSLARQMSTADFDLSFEVIVVDDGSSEAAPAFIRDANYSYPLRLIEQPHAGIPAARNRGVEAAKGKVLLFVDADCRLRENCLAALSCTIARWPQHDCFQLRLVGDRSNLVGRAEELRLMALQQHMLQADGRIRYLNTAGFAMRRTRADLRGGVFDPRALRAEDTLLLVNLMQVGELPFFVPEAVVEHVIHLSLLGCLRKDVQSVFLELRTYRIIAAKRMNIRVTHRERLKLIGSMWRSAGQSSIGRSAWFVVTLRQALQRSLSLTCQYLGAGSTERRN
ncbi:MAG: glycosyltransferase family 2 protein [Candidatus Sulfotelmatobacter sp.]|jgi:glycosyltransferase involved in cell wall biosynthesis